MPLTINDLIGEQRNVLTIPFENPVLIKGSAGSGKTTVAIFRAIHLRNAHPDLFFNQRIMIFSYTNHLVNYIRTILPDVSPEVMTLHRWAGRLCSEIEICRETKTMIRNAIWFIRQQQKTEKILDQAVDFFEAEFSWIKGHCITEKQAYIDKARTGRGTMTRVLGETKNVIWSVFDKYNQLLREQRLYDFDDLILCALRKTELPNFIPPFSHIVVDEAQDMTKAQLMLISKLVNPQINSVTLVADSAQRIYQSGFSWADTGLNVRGRRSYEFKMNYRNTVEIAKAAFSLLSHETDRSDFTETTTPRKVGAKPVIVRCDNKAQFCLILDWINNRWNKQGSAVIALPTNVRVAEYVRQFENLKLSVYKLPREREAVTIENRIFVATYHSIKGLEFDHVFLGDLNSGSFESQKPDDDELSLKRKLLYVGMTRARQTLTLFASRNNPSLLLNEIDKETIDSREVTECAMPAINQQ